MVAKNRDPAPMKNAVSLSGIGCPAGTAGSLQTDPLNGVWVERLADTTPGRR